MSEFRIEKIRHNVEITLVTGERMIGTMFLEPIARNHAGAQDPRELLNEEGDFFPLETRGKVILVARDQVKLAKYPVDRGALTALRTTNARLILVDGHSLEGAIIIEARTEADRLLDHLNHFDGRFLPMLTANRQTQCLVNRRMIVGVEQEA
ncbi:MAG TPA: hypothetical protein VFO55_00910 [Gemmatimonadaceae bacterium]|nr:hypothetical protein [Gemmatimonadaceae bacterium]